MDTDRAPYGYIHREDDYLRRLRRIEGPARGPQRIVEDERPGPLLTAPDLSACG